MEEKRTVIKMILLEQAALLLKINKMTLLQAVEENKIKTQLISNHNKNCLFLDMENLIEFCQQNKIDYAILKKQTIPHYSKI